MSIPDVEPWRMALGGLTGMSLLGRNGLWYQSWTSMVTAFF
jgi:hypothetical protein